MNDAKKSNTQANSFQIKRIKPRYINIQENIYEALSNDAMAVYIALRFEADYSTHVSSVDKNIQFLCNKAKIKRTRCKECIDEIEAHGLIKIQRNPGYQSTYWVADELNYFSCDPVEQAPSRTPTDPSRTATTPGRTATDINTNPSTNSSTGYKSAREDEQNSTTPETPPPAPDSQLTETDNEVECSSPQSTEKDMTRNEVGIPPHGWTEDGYITNFEANAVVHSPDSQQLVNNQTAGYALSVQELDTFERFWELYPRKHGKPRAQAQWFHDGCHLIADRIIATLQEQLKKQRYFLDGCAPNPERYIMEQRYNDEIYEGKKTKTTGADIDQALKSTDWRHGGK